jgi:hypothetical protein
MQIEYWRNEIMVLWKPALGRKFSKWKFCLNINISTFHLSIIPNLRQIKMLHKTLLFSIGCKVCDILN